MPQRKKHAQQFVQGCKICGDSVGRGISQHVSAHGVDYEQYRKCFKSGRIITDDLTEAGRTKNGRTVVIHVLVRKFLVKPTREN